MKGIPFTFTLPLLALARLQAQQAVDPAVIETPAESQLQLVFPKNGKPWKLEYNAKDGVQHLQEYTREGETLHNWTELYSVHTFPSVNLSPEQFYQHFVDKLKDSLKPVSPTVKIIKNQPNWILFEWEAHNPQTANDHEWVLVMKQNKGLGAVRYTTKKLNQVETMRPEVEASLSQTAEAHK